MLDILITESLQYKVRILDRYYHDHDGLFACNRTIDIYDIEDDTWLPMCTNKGKLLQQHLNWIRLNYTTFKGKHLTCLQPILQNIFRS